MGSKTLLGSLWKVLIHCDFSNSDCLRNYYEFTANISHGVSIFTANTGHGVSIFVLNAS